MANKSYTEKNPFDKDVTPLQRLAFAGGCLVGAPFVAVLMAGIMVFGAGYLTFLAIRQVIIGENF